ncbi:hypothetical protein LY78DRAFT_660590 [Colletotrichum sublineola]|nr:hypothetical protein LY78DRAFT_660590 [Colletotrichum sublineola]
MRLINTSPHFLSHGSPPPIHYLHPVVVVVIAVVSSIYTCNQWRRQTALSLPVTAVIAKGRQQRC